jgi:hypothetical protein
MVMAWQVKTYVDIHDAGVLPGVMPLIELTVIFEREAPPSPLLIETLCKVLIPEGRSLISEIIQVGDVPNP